MIPAPFHTVDQILDRMADAGFQPDEVVQLMTAHSVAAQHGVDPALNVSVMYLHVELTS